MAEGACRGVVAGGFGEARGEGAKETNRRGYIPRDWLKKRIYMKGPASEEQEPLLQEEPEWLMEEEAKLRKNIYDPLGITRKGFSRWVQTTAFLPPRLFCGHLRVPLGPLFRWGEKLAGLPVRL